MMFTNKKPVILAKNTDTKVFSYEREADPHISRQKLLHFSESYWKWREMGEIARDTQLSQTWAREKKTNASAGVSHARCYRCAFKKRTRRKVGVDSACGVSVARRGFPAARRRDRNRSAWRSARSHALCVAPPRKPLAHSTSLYVKPSHSSDSAPHASHGRPRFPAVRSWSQHGRTSLQISAYPGPDMSHGLHIPGRLISHKITYMVPMELAENARTTKR